MAIFGMYENPETGELQVVLDDRIVSVSGAGGQPFSANNIVQKVVGKYGKDDPMGIFVRTTHQVERLVHVSTIGADGDKVKQLMKIVAAYRDRLYMMLDCILFISEECKRCDKEFACNDGQVQLPQVNDLQEKVEGFLLNGKKALAEASKILSVFFDYQETGHNYTAHHKWAKSNLCENSDVTKVLEDHVTGDEWPKYLVDMRNRVEHPNQNYWLKVQNIEFEPVSKKMVMPAWSTDAHPTLSDILTDMHVLLNNILVMSEDLIAVCVMQTITSPCIAVGRIPNEKIDPQLPLRWEIFITEAAPPSEDSAAARIDS